MIADVLSVVAAWLAAGEAVALATVVETSGSAPCPVGSQLAISRSFRIAGSVSGGCVDNAVAEAALATLATGQSRMLEFGTRQNHSWEIGIPCGGRIRILVEPLA